MRRLLYLAVLSMLVMLVAAPAALAQTTGVNPVLDADDNYSGGVVVGDDTPDCATPEQVLPSGLCAEAPITTTEGPTPAAAQYDQYAPAADQYAAPADDDTDALPATGGPALLLSAGVLLLGAGLLGMKLVRRS